MTASGEPAPAHAGSDPGDELMVFGYFHIALGAMIGMVALVPAVYLAIGRELQDVDLQRDATGASVLANSVGLSLTLTVIGMAAAAVVTWGGARMLRRRGWRSCVFSSIVGCLFFPLGTLLGGITLSRLFDPDLRGAFRDG
jgi:hypothetical protein